MVLVALASLASAGNVAAGKKSEKSKKKKKKNGKGDDPSNNVRKYFKVLATFQCSKDNCKKAWNSAHAWDRGDDGTNCEVCEKPADLVNALDEMLKLDTYQCSCDNMWQSIHFGEGDQQECDNCGDVVVPVGPPQERFGRHYFFKCMNKICETKPEWEDFSTEGQKTQRCTKCYSRGDIKKVEKLPLQPHRIIKKAPPGSKSKEKDGGWIKVDGQNKIIGFGYGKGPSKHNKDFCDMCQDVIRQGVGRSCHQFRRVVCIVTHDTKEGNVLERIVQVSTKS